MRLIAILLVALVLSVSCGKDDGPAPTPVPPTPPKPVDVAFDVNGKFISVKALVTPVSKVPASQVEFAVRFAVDQLEN